MHIKLYNAIHVSDETVNLTISQSERVSKVKKNCKYQTHKRRLYSYNSIVTINVQNS